VGINIWVVDKIRVHKYLSDNKVKINLRNQALQPLEVINV